MYIITLLTQGFWHKHGSHAIDMTENNPCHVKESQSIKTLQSSSWLIRIEQDW